MAAYFFHQNGSAPNKKSFFRVDFSTLEKELSALFPSRWKEDYTEQEFIKREAKYKQKHKVWFLEKDIWIRYRNDYESMAATLYYLASADLEALRKTEELLGESVL